VKIVIGNSVSTFKVADKTKTYRYRPCLYLSLYFSASSALLHCWPGGLKEMYRFYRCVVSFQMFTAIGVRIVVCWIVT
jgi:hypothetical protein